MTLRAGPGGSRVLTLAFVDLPANHLTSISKLLDFCLENVPALCLCSFRVRARYTVNLLRLLWNCVLAGLSNMSYAWRFLISWGLAILLQMNHRNHGCWFQSSFHRPIRNTGDWHPNSVSFLCVCTSIHIFNLVEDVSDLRQVCDWGLETQVSG